MEGLSGYRRNTRKVGVPYKPDGLGLGLENEEEFTNRSW